MFDRIANGKLGGRIRSERIAAAPKRALTTLVAGCVLLAAPAAANAAVTLGAVDPVANPGETCAGNVSFVQTATGGPTIAAPTAGVITRWRHKGNVGSTRLVMWRATGDPAMFIVVGRSATQVSTDAAPDFATRIPVAAGDQIGLRTVGASSSCFYSGVAADDTRNSGGVAIPSDGFTQTFPNGPFDQRLNVEADLEPDADGDGFGDETQDGCTTDTAVQTACLPTGLATDPASPADGTTPRVKGLVQGGTTVKLYTDAACTSLAATGNAGDFNGGGIQVTVADGSTTTFNATATGAIGGESDCSAGSVTYVEQDSPPAPPTGLATNPAGPATDNTPRVSGSAQPGSTVKVYTNAACSGAHVAADFAADFGAAGVAVNVPDNSVTTFHATATDGGGESGCSAASATYTELTPAVDDPAPDPAPDTTAPKVTFVNPGARELARKVKLDLTCDEDCDATVTGKVILREKSATKGRHQRQTLRVALKPASASLAANEQETLALGLSKRKLKRLTRGLRVKGARARAKLSVATTDAAGNSASETLTLRLRRR